MRIYIIYRYPTPYTHTPTQIKIVVAKKMGISMSMANIAADLSVTKKKLKRKICRWAKCYRPTNTRISLKAHFCRFLSIYSTISGRTYTVSSFQWALINLQGRRNERIIWLLVLAHTQMSRIDRFVDWKLHFHTNIVSGFQCVFMFSFLQYIQQSFFPWMRIRYGASSIFSIKHFPKTFPSFPKKCLIDFDEIAFVLSGFPFSIQLFTH